MKIKTQLSLKNLEIRFYEGEVIEGKATVFAKGETVGGEGAFKGTFDLRFDLSDGEADAIKELFQKRCTKEADET